MKVLAFGVYEVCSLCFQDVTVSLNLHMAKRQFGAKGLGSFCWVFFFFKILVIEPRGAYYSPISSVLLFKFLFVIF